LTDIQDVFVQVLNERELQEGSMKLVKVNGLHVLLVKTQGRIFAVENHCPHMYCGLSGGSLDGYTIICPCHDWHFDLRTGEYEEEKEIKLMKYEWKIESGKIWAKIE